MLEIRPPDEKQLYGGQLNLLHGGNVRADIVIREIIQHVPVALVLFEDPEDIVVLALIRGNDLPVIRWKHDDRVALGPGFESADDKHDG